MAGIGGTSRGECGYIGLYNCDVQAYGGMYGSGIGAGDGSACAGIEFGYANVTAQGGSSVAGIGAGTTGSCGPIAIDRGCEINATGKDSAPGIGAGPNAECGDIEILRGIRGVVAKCGSSGSDPIGTGGGDGIVFVGMGLMDDNGTPPRTITNWSGDLGELTCNVTIPSGMTICGTMTGKYKVSIAAGAKVTISNATIAVANVASDVNCKWAGLTCLGNAEITLVKSNRIRSFYDEYPGIFVPEDKTLSITGDGSLRAESNGYAAGIGGGSLADCGDISITGGSVVATGGASAAGIGTGNAGTCNSICIGPGIIRVEATHGDGGIDAIGRGTTGSTLTSGEPDIHPSLVDDKGDPTRTIASASAADPLVAYKAWAKANGVSGEWNSVDSYGIANVFRYVFNKPTGDFAILDISFNEYGYVVIFTRPLVNGDGFTLAIVASANPDGTGIVVEHGLNPSSVTVIGETP